uniref:Uncharacterized protein n=1 Tax=Octopus bimaculoides TaxID=37653 RepID=A0A0L8G1K6_OCTBM
MYSISSPREITLKVFHLELPFLYKYTRCFHDTAQSKQTVRSGRKAEPWNFKKQWKS